MAEALKGEALSGAASKAQRVRIRASALGRGDALLDSPSPSSYHRAMLFPYPGSKFGLMPKYLRLFPPHKHFVDVFGGSGAAILGKPRSRLETLNDIDPAIINLFTIVRDGRLDELKHLCRYTPNKSRRMFEEARAIVKSNDADPVRSAWAFLYIAYVCNGSRNPCAASPADFGFVRAPHSCATIWEGITRTLETVCNRLKRVQLTNWPWERCIDLLDTPDTLFFLDPSYYPPTLQSLHKLYEHVLTIADHKKMLARLQKIEGKVFLCGYSHPDYERALRGWHSHEFEVTTNMGRKGTASLRIEKCWMNYDPEARR